MADETTRYRYLRDHPTAMRVVAHRMALTGDGLDAAVDFARALDLDGRVAVHVANGHTHVAARLYWSATGSTFQEAREHVARLVCPSVPITIMVKEPA